MGIRAGEVAQMLESTEESVTSALKRARATLRRQHPPSNEGEAAPAAQSAAERELVERFARAFEAGDVNTLVALLTEDVLLAMPPIPFEWLGPELASGFFTAMWTALGPPLRLVATRANGQPAFALYVPDQDAGGFQALGVLVLRLTGGGIRAITRFDAGVLAHLGLPANRQQVHPL